MSEAQGQPTAPAVSPDTRSATRGIVIMSVSVLCLCINDAIAKTLTEHYNPLQILFMRNLIALPMALIIALRMGGPRALVSYNPLAHLVRGLLWIAAAYMFFTGLSMLALAEATTLIFIAPIFVTAISALFLKDHVGWRRWSFVLLGFAGVLVVVRPGSSAFQPASLYPLATAFLYATMMLTSRWVDPRESVWTLMLYLVGFGMVLSGLLQPLVWIELRSSDLWLFLGIAIFGTFGVTLMTEAFRHAPASIIAPLDYTSLVWATLLGWAFWDELPDLATYIGSAIIIMSGLFIILNERKSKTD